MQVINLSVKDLGCELAFVTEDSFTGGSVVPLEDVKKITKTARSTISALNSFLASRTDLSENNLCFWLNQLEACLKEKP